MSLQIGRFGIDVDQTNVATLDQTGNDVTVTGVLSASAGPVVSGLREQVIGLKDNPFELFYPVVYDEHPYVNGYYVVTDAQVSMIGGSLEIGYFSYSIAMTRLPSGASPLMEGRLLGVCRPNGVAVTHCVGWEAVPASASGFSGASNHSERDTSDGAIRIYDDGTDGMLNTFTKWACPPQNWYDGSARIRIGPIAPLDSSAYEFTGGSQDYVVAADVTQVLVDVRGAQGGGRYGGRGGRTAAIIDVTPGETLKVYVGGRGGLSNGGWNGGGNGNAGSVPGAQGYGTSGDGYGGGGGSDVRQGGTTLGSRQIVAGGGGGMGGANPKGAAGFIGGAGSGTNGFKGHNPEGTGGLGGTSSSGGAHGTPWGGGTAGTNGALGVGGNGGNAPVADRYGAGGGGGGLYGGGGGSTSGYMSASGSGGGGSGFSAGASTRTWSGYNAGNGSIFIIPITDEMPVDRYTVIGDQCIDSPYGWELSNGIVSVQPVYTAVKTSFRVRGWNGAGWSEPRDWDITDNNSSTDPADVNLSAMTVIRNTPEECIIRCSAEYSDNSEIVTFTLGIRRGSPVVDISLNCPTAKQWGIRCTTTTTSDALTGNGFVEHAVQSDGTKIFAITNYFATQELTGENGFYLGSDEVGFHAGVGVYYNAWADTAANCLRQWYAAETETVRAVLR